MMPVEIPRCESSLPVFQAAAYSAVYMPIPLLFGSHQPVIPCTASMRCPNEHLTASTLVDCAASWVLLVQEHRIRSNKSLDFSISLLRFQIPSAKSHVQGIAMRIWWYERTSLLQNIWADETRSHILTCSISRPPIEWPTNKTGRDVSCWLLRLFAGSVKRFSACPKRLFWLENSKAFAAFKS